MGAYSPLIVNRFIGISLGNNAVITSLEKSKKRACNLQAVFSHLVSSGFHGEIGNLFKPMRKPKNPDEHGHRDDRKMQ